jgi:hypothetical protein
MGESIADWWRCEINSLAPPFLSALQNVVRAQVGEAGR